MNITLNLALKQVARTLCIDTKQVEAVYKSYWKFVRNHIENLNFTNITEEDFSKMTTNFNIPYVGKLYTDYGRVTRYNNRKKYYKNAKIKKS